MSHFKIIIVSNDVAKTMEPYFESSNIQKVSELEEYKQDWLQDEHNYETFREFLMKEYGFTILSSDDEKGMRRLDQAEFKYAVADKDTGEIIDIFKFYNPKARIDGYSRISWDLLKRKDGKMVNHLENIQDLDIDGTFGEIEENYRNTYRNFIEAFGSVPTIEKGYWQCLEEAGAKYEKYLKTRIAMFEGQGKFVPTTELERRKKKQQDLIDKGFEFYWNQEAVKRCQELNIELPDYFCCTEEEYVKNACIPVNAIVTDQDWYCRSRVGWFASEEMVLTNTEWAELQRKVLKELQETNEALYIGVYDCHI